MSDCAPGADCMSLPIKIVEQMIDPASPWTDDKLGRKECADVLTGLLANQTEPLTVSLNGEWGSGKTFMLKRWRQQLENDGYKAIYFNAWEDDFVPDPLVAILGQLQARLPEEPAVKEFLAGAGQVLATVANGIFKKTTGVDIEDAAEKASKTASTRNTKLLDEYTAVLGSRQELRHRLQRMANALFENSRKPLIFIIDELDRCRPPFAIELLERVKHMFNIEHVVFVLGIDRKQLGQAIRSVYGDIDSENYLHRFVDVDFRLPQVQGNRYLSVLWEKHGIPSYLLALGTRLGRGGRHRDEGGYFRNIFAVLLKGYALTLREIEQCVKLYAIVLTSSSNEYTVYPLLLPLLIVLKLRNSDLYVRYISLSCPVIDVIEFAVPSSGRGRRNDAWKLELIIYSTYAGSSSKSKHVTEVKEMLKAMRDKKPIAHMSCVSARVKQWSDPDELIQKFCEPLERIAGFGGFEGIEYDEHALLGVTKKLDLIMTGVEQGELL